MLFEPMRVYVEFAKFKRNKQNLEFKKKNGLNSGISVRSSKDSKTIFSAKKKQTPSKFSQ
jgi:hypothetical protein